LAECFAIPLAQLLSAHCFLTLAASYAFIREVMRAPGLMLTLMLVIDKRLSGMT
jgi:hypothetical protein